MFLEEGGLRGEAACMVLLEGLRGEASMPLVRRGDSGALNKEEGGHAADTWPGLAEAFLDLSL
jgi:hypothetical protein